MSPSSPARALFVCAHGAGGHRDDRSMRSIAAALGPHGIEVLRFDFPYRARGARRPDPMPVLKECFQAVVERARPRLEGRRLLIGGRSLGGRVASMIAAEAFPCDGLLLLAYPLHPPGQPERLRTAHLPAIRVPVLCINGTRDAFCTRERMDEALAGLHGWTLHWLEDADHSFRVRKSSGRDEADICREVGEVVGQWLRAGGA